MAIKNVLKYPGYFNSGKVKESLLETRQGGIYILASRGKSNQGLQGYGLAV